MEEALIFKSINYWKEVIQMGSEDVVMCKVSKEWGPPHDK